MKKSALIFGAFVLMSIMLLNFVSAQIAIEEVLQTITNVIEPITKWIVGDTGGDSALLFAKFLLLIIVVALVWYPVKLFPGLNSNNALAFVISFAVGLLGIRFLADEIIATITLPYSTFAVAITALLPLVLYFLWVNKALQANRTMRKVAWIFATVVFVGLFFARYDDISRIARGFNPVWYYAIAGGLCVIFFFADRTIQRVWRKAQMEAFDELHKEQKLAELLTRNEEIRKQFEEGHRPEDSANRAIENLKRIAKSNDVDESAFTSI